MKKIVSVLICLMMLLSVIPFTVSAAGEAKFTLRIKEETDKSLTLVMDFDGGTGFSALDFEIEYDRVRLQAKGAKKGDGYKAFENKLNDPVTPIYSSNANNNPIMFSMANISPFKVTDGEKSIAEIVFTKVPGTKFEKNDVSVKFTNCQTDKFEDIKVNFSVDLTAPEATEPTKTPTENKTDYPQEPSSDNIDDETNEIGEPVDGNTQSNANSDESSSQAVENENAENSESNTKTIVVIVVSVLVVAGVGIIILLKFKKKK